MESRLARVATAAPLSLGRLGGRLDAAAARIPTLAGSLVERRRQTVDQLAALVAARDPARLLERGWSITRYDDGSIVTSPELAPTGTRLHTTVAGGRITSVVSEGDDT